MLVASWITARLGVTVVHPKDGSIIAAVNLLDREGLRRIFTEAVRNFMGFAPLGIVLVAMMGVGVAEKTGLITLSLRAFVTSMPPTLLTAAVIFAGMLAHLAADAGIIILPPIAAMLFAAAGRNPARGARRRLRRRGRRLQRERAALAARRAAHRVHAGGDQGLEAAARLRAAGAGQLLLPHGHGSGAHRGRDLGHAPLRRAAARAVEARAPTRRRTRTRSARSRAAERRGLRAAGLALALTVAFFLVLVLPRWAPLRGSGATILEQLKPFFDSIIILIMLLFFIPGLTFGIASGKIRSDRDVTKMTGDTLATMGTYIVLAFTAAQFIAFFAWSNLGGIVAISGARFLKGMGFHGAPLLVGLILFSASLDFFITSASAKWAMMAPVFVPMFAMLGFTPECTQVVFRIGASVVNIITPCFPYLPILIVAARRYDPKAGAGTLISMMLPYSIAFLVSWTALLLAFYWLHWPIGPGVMMRLPGY